jgi:7-carboxy-7-deazaguanine synthase
MRISEVFTSVQGEGPNTGSPITFVRFGGCNLRCSGWGEGLLPDGTSVPGCDTVYAVYPQWRDNWEKITPRELLNDVPLNPPHVCLTGGEPLIQPNGELEEFAGGLLSLGLRIDLFTNGSIHLDPRAYEWAHDQHTTVVMDYKLCGSGETDTFDKRNFSELQKKDALKFVCADEEDFWEALAVVDAHRTNAQLWFGVVWGKMTNARLAEMMTQEGLFNASVNVQTHKYIGLE